MGKIENIYGYNWDFGGNLSSIFGDGALSYDWANICRNFTYLLFERINRKADW